MPLDLVPKPSGLPMSKGWQFYMLMMAIGFAFGSAAEAAYNARKANRAIQQIAAAIEEARHE